MEYIAYKSGYKYQLKKDYVIAIGILPDDPVNTDYLALTACGALTVKKGYAWDGPSGPVIDTLNFMRGSLVHDALYQLFREQLLDKNKHRQAADWLLHKICRDDGMSALRAGWVYLAVRLGGDPAADPVNERPVIHAPKACR